MYIFSHAFPMTTPHSFLYHFLDGWLRLFVFNLWKKKMERKMKKSSFISSFFSSSLWVKRKLLSPGLDRWRSRRPSWHCIFDMNSSSYHMYLIKFNDVRLGCRGVWVYRLTHAVLPQPFFVFRQGETRKSMWYYLLLFWLEKKEKSFIEKYL